MLGSAISTINSSITKPHHVQGQKQGMLRSNVSVLSKAPINDLEHEPERRWHPRFSK